MKTNPTLCHSSLEPLESRIAPAAVSLTYTDVDGDLVKITASHGNLTMSDLTTAGVGLGSQLQEINLTDPSFEGANISITVTKAAKSTGDGFVNVGLIDAGTNDLGSVIVQGDLGEITAGSGSGQILALKSLTVHSMGVLGDTTGRTSQASDLAGNVGPVKISGDLANAMFEVNGNVASLTVGGSLLGSATSNSACVSVTGNIGPVKIGGDIIGSGAGSGEIEAGGKLAGITVGGSIIGGSGAESGAISSGGKMGAVLIGGSIQGGVDDDTGQITSSSYITSVTVKGSLIGGAGGNSGEIEAISSIATVNISGSVVGGAGNNSGEIFGSSSSAFSYVFSLSIGGSLVGGAGNDSGLVSFAYGIYHAHIGHNIVGGSISGTNTLTESGAIISAGFIETLTVGGSVRAGVNDSTASGALSFSGAIQAAHDIDTITVGGSLVGTTGSGGVDPVIISAVGVSPVSATAIFDPAITSLTVRGDVEYANVLAGYDASLIPTNGGAGIGSVKVGGDWVASNLVAGVENSGAPANTSFGNSDDSLAPSTGDLVAKIESITIGGEVDGVAGGTGHFGFVAAAIGSMKIGTNSLKLPASGDYIQLSPLTGDVAVHLVS